MKPGAGLYGFIARSSDDDSQERIARSNCDERLVFDYRTRVCSGHESPYPQVGGIDVSEPEQVVVVSCPQRKPNGGVGD